MLICIVTWQSVQAAVTNADMDSATASTSCEVNSEDGQCITPTSPPKLADKKKSFTKLFSTGKKAYKRGDWKKTIALMEHIFKLYPHSKLLHEVFDLKGMAHTGLLEGKAALLCFQGAMLSSQKLSVTSSHGNGIIEQINKIGKDHKAFQELVQSHVQQSAQHIQSKTKTKEGIKNANLLYSTAILLEALGNEKETHKLMSRVVSLEPHHAGAKIFFAQRAADTGDRTKAITLLQESLAMEPNQVGVDEIWKILAAHLSAVNAQSVTCSDAWVHAFETALERVPRNEDGAALALAAAGKTMLEQGRPVAEVFTKLICTVLHCTALHCTAL